MQRHLVIVLLAVLHLTCSFDLATYEQKYQTQVGIPYKNAITIVATDIIEYLAVTPVPTTIESGHLILTTLKAKAQIFSTDLDTASQSSDALRQQLDREVEQLVAQASAVEQQIASNEQQLQETNNQIQQTNAQLADAQNQVNAAQSSVQHAEQVVREEEERVSKARDHCTFFGGWFGHKLCQVVNHEGINRANGDRDRAQNDLNNQRQRLAGIQATQNQLIQKQTDLQQQRTNFGTNKVNLQAQLIQLNQARDNVNNVDIALKALIAHVGTLLGKSQVLADIVKNLIDMETIIQPLTAIADQIITYTPNADDVTYLNLMKDKISTSLPLVQQKLSQYALIP